MAKTPAAVEPEADGDVYTTEISIVVRKNGQEFARRTTDYRNMGLKHFRRIEGNLIAMDQKMFDESE